MDRKDFVKTADEWQALPGALESIARLNQAGWHIMVVSNQSGLGRGHFDMSALNAMHDKLHSSLAKVGGKASAVRAELQPHLPAELATGTDRYDAAICALMALQYAAKGTVSLLPPLIQAPADMVLDEGWVYHFARP